MGSKKWVFKELVKNDKDPIGLIAYSLYKCEKNKKATSLKEEGLSQDEIKKRLDDFQSYIVDSSKILSGFTKEAEQVISDSIAVVKKKMEDEYVERYSTVEKHAKEFQRKRKELEIREEKLGKLEKKEKNKIIKKIRQEECNKIKSAAIEHTQSHWFKRSLWWVWSGFASVTAVFIICGVFFLYIGITSSEAEKTSLRSKLSLFLVESVTKPPFPELSSKKS